MVGTALSRPFGKAVRMERLFGSGDDNLLLLALDHSVAAGPIADVTTMSQLIGMGAEQQVDGVVLHKGRLRCVNHRLFREMSLIVHLNASTMHAPDADAKVLVTSVAEALRHGADAVSIHINMGSDQEARQLRDLGTVAEACDQWNMPLLAMMYPRGPRIDDPQSPELVAHAVAVAVDLGADVVKTVPTRSALDMVDVVNSSPIPIIVAGGIKLAGRDGFLERTQALMKSGIQGVAVGRNFFDDDDPAKLLRGLRPIVHPNAVHETPRTSSEGT